MKQKTSFKLGAAIVGALCISLFVLAIFKSSMFNAPVGTTVTQKTVAGKRYRPSQMQTSVSRQPTTNKSAMPSAKASHPSMPATISTNKDPAVTLPNTGANDTIALFFAAIVVGTLIAHRRQLQKQLY